MSQHQPQSVQQLLGHNEALKEMVFELLALEEQPHAQELLDLFQRSTSLEKQLRESLPQSVCQKQLLSETFKVYQDYVDELGDMARQTSSAVEVKQESLNGLQKQDGLLREITSMAEVSHATAQVNRLLQKQIAALNETERQIQASVKTDTGVKAEEERMKSILNEAQRRIQEKEQRVEELRLQIAKAEGSISQAEQHHTSLTLQYQQKQRRELKGQTIDEAEVPKPEAAPVTSEDKQPTEEQNREPWVHEVEINRSTGMQIPLFGLLLLATLLLALI